jgi:hypothetical protein
MITLVGYNETREEGIRDQWQITNTHSLRNRDPALYGLLTNTEYNFPKTAPDGSYGDLSQWILKQHCNVSLQNLNKKGENKGESQHHNRQWPLRLISQQGGEVRTHSGKVHRKAHEG